MRAGRMRHRVTIEEAVTTRDDHGGEVQHWIPFAVRWAEVRPLIGKEFYAAQAEHAEVSTLLRLRYLDGVTTLMRVNYGGRLYDIHHVKNVGERGAELHLMTSEQVT